VSAEQNVGGLGRLHVVQGGGHAVGVAAGDEDGGAAGRPSPARLYTRCARRPAGGAPAAVGPPGVPPLPRPAGYPVAAGSVRPGDRIPAPVRPGSGRESVEVTRAGSPTAMSGRAPRSG
jgi:hypothetical protein